MPDKNRRCVKCGASTASQPGLVLHRFPKPGSWNVRRLEEWARFCYPEEDWASPDFQKKLFTSHKMLCYRHFTKSSFINHTEKKLHRYAVPVENVDQDSQPSTSVSNEQKSKYIVPLGQ